MKKTAPHSRHPRSFMPYSNFDTTPGFVDNKSSGQTNSLMCPLTGNVDIEVLETFSTSLLIDGYQRDLSLKVSTLFAGVEHVQLCRCITSDMIFFHPSITGSQEFYRQLQAFSWYFPDTKFEYDHAARWIPPNQDILDIGCGAAQFMKKLSKVSYTGLDPHCMTRKNVEPHDLHIHSETITEHAQTHVHQYDVVCTFQVLEHVADPKVFLTAALTCLKPGGLFIVGVPSAESYVTRIPNFVLNAPPHHVTWWTDQALLSMAHQFQLSVLDLAHAPVESWESRLYWMQRILDVFPPKNTSYFTEKLSRRLSTIAAYMGARFIMLFSSPPTSARGSSVVMVAKKNDGVSC